MPSPDELARLASCMHVLFASSAQPDVEFGVFRAFYVPGAGGGDAPASGPALVQLDLSGLRSAPHVRLHVVLERRQVAALRDVRGGDEARLAVLTGEMGVRLLGRQAPRPDLPALVAAVAEAKGVALQVLAAPAADDGTGIPAVAAS
eukprot:210949-Chlamydomonas_euryale.AAC.6